MLWFLANNGMEGRGTLACCFPQPFSEKSTTPSGAVVAQQGNAHGPAVTGSMAGFVQDTSCTTLSPLLPVLPCDMASRCIYLGNMHLEGPLLVPGSRLAGLEFSPRLRCGAPHDVAGGPLGTHLGGREAHGVSAGQEGR